MPISPNILLSQPPFISMTHTELANLLPLAQSFSIKDLPSPVFFFLLFPFTQHTLYSSSLPARYNRFSPARFLLVSLLSKPIYTQRFQFLYPLLLLSHHFLHHRLSSLPSVFSAPSSPPPQCLVDFSAVWPAPSRATVALRLRLRLRLSLARKDRPLG